MIRSRSVFLTPAARAAGVPVDELHQAAVSASRSAGDEPIWFQAIRVRGKQFAIATRVVIEVDYLPNRVPEAIVKHPLQGSRGRAR
jgi:hypothetical protein